MKTILYLTDLYYQAKGRVYYQEDLFIVSKLKEHFKILIGNPQQVNAYLDCADIIIFRNTGPVAAYETYFNEFVGLVKEKNILTFNSFDGKADQQGKHYLPELTARGLPVIKTIDKLEHLDLLENPEKYIVKTLNGADSIGMEILSEQELRKADLKDRLIQPFIYFEYELSFYYLNNDFQYALYAPDKAKRWELTQYDFTEEDIAFADQFIKWNDLTRGITRVDACRCKDGSLQLVELEDLNPYLSLDVLSPESQEQFINNWVDVLKSV
jgi:hypothetical protein